MSLFSCCPKKPKKTLDYVIKWVEDTDKTIKDLDTWVSSIKGEDLKPIFDEYAEEYDWSQVPAFDTKVDKVPGASYGSLAFFDGTGNITSSFYSTKHLVDISVSNGVVSSRILEVNLPSPDTAVYGAVSVVEHNGESVDIVLSTGLKGAATPVLKTTITHDNIGNLDRALQDPDTEPTEDSDKLITSGAVKSALYDFALADHNHNNAYAPKTHTHFINAISGLDEYLAALSARVAALEEAVTPVSWETVEEIILGESGSAGQNRYSSTDNNLFGLTHYADYRIGDRVRLAGITDTEIVVEGEILAKSTGPDRILLSIDLSSIINNGYHYNLQKVAASNNE